MPVIHMVGYDRTGVAKICCKPTEGTDFDNLSEKLSIPIRLTDLLIALEDYKRLRSIS